MKLQNVSDPNLNTITGYGPGYLEINRIRMPGSALLQPRGQPQPWAVTEWQALAENDFEAMLALGPELVLLGTGARQHFVHPRHYARLTSARIGVEMMDTGAACRTYNILVAEGRQVLAALIPLRRSADMRLCYRGLKQRRSPRSDKPPGSTQPGASN